MDFRGESAEIVHFGGRMSLTKASDATRGQSLPAPPTLSLSQSTDTYEQEVQVSGGRYHNRLRGTVFTIEVTSERFTLSDRTTSYFSCLTSDPAEAVTAGAFAGPPTLWVIGGRRDVNSAY